MNLFISKEFVTHKWKVYRWAKKWINFPI